MSPELCRDLHISFDPGAVPRDEFVVAGDAWIRCTAAESRALHADPQFRVPAHVYKFVRQRNEPVIDVE